MNLLNFLQKTIMACGLLIGSLLTLWYIHIKKFTVGDFVLYTSYIEQLYTPLLMFGTYYRLYFFYFMKKTYMFVYTTDTHTHICTFVVARIILFLNNLWTVVYLIFGNLLCWYINLYLDEQIRYYNLYEEVYSAVSYYFVLLLCCSECLI